MPPPWTQAVDFVADRVARAKTAIRSKLLLGFVAVALSLFGMVVLSWAVMVRMSQRVTELERLQERVSDLENGIPGHGAQPLRRHGYPHRLRIQQ